MKFDSSALIDLGLFVFTLICAWVFQWQSGDLAWSLWTSSLIVGYITLIFGPLASGIQKIPWMTIIQKDFSDYNIRDEIKSILRSKNTWMIVGIIFLAAAFYVGFFTIHFGMFHFIHGIFLQSFFPLSATPYPKSGWNLAGFAITMGIQYWPFVLASAVSQFVRIESKNASPIKGGMMAPYVSVMRMHFLIFIFAGLNAINASNFVVYAIILLFYFLPWSVFQKQQQIRPQDQKRSEG